MITSGNSQALEQAIAASSAVRGRWQMGSTESPDN